MLKFVNVSSQAVQARQDQAHITSQTVVSRRMECERSGGQDVVVVVNGDDGRQQQQQLQNDENHERVSPADFRQRLAFFQNRTNDSSSSVISNGKCTEVKKTSSKCVTASKNDDTWTAKCDVDDGPKMVPNVDDVLLSVKLLRESRERQQHQEHHQDVNDYDERWTADDSDDSDTYQQRQFNHYEKLFNAHDEGSDIREMGDEEDEDDEYETRYDDEDDEDEEDEVDGRYIQHGGGGHDVGLEVIIEEDEDDKDDFDEVMDKFQRSGQPADCDSGVTDDQRSNSTADELDSLAGDTDSAKGSMVPDAASQTSPTSSLGIGKDLEMLESNKFMHPSDPKTNKVHFAEPSYSLNEQVDRIFQPCDAEASNGFSSLEDNLSKPNGHHDNNSEYLSCEWDPTKLLKELYSTKFPDVKHTHYDSSKYINIEGYLEKLPSGRKKATFWNPWKRKYFKATDGYLYYYEQNNTEKETICLQLMGGSVDTLDNNMIGVDDGKGHYLVMKCANKEEASRWHRALLSHCMENFILTYVQPVEYALRSHKDVVIIDLGTCSVRAGILAEQPTLPQIFFPAVCATDINTGNKVFGIDALKPEIRKNSNITYPLSPQQSKFSLDIESFPALLEKIFKDLDVDPQHFQVQFCITRKFSMQTQIAIARIMFDKFKVDGISMTQQSVAALYSYNASSGIIVDIGYRLDILPVIDGYIVESGVTQTPYGGQRILHHLKQALAHKQYSFESDAESCLVRYALEQLCFVAQDFKQEMNNFQMDPDSLEKSVSLSKFQSTVPELVLDSGRFSVTEGLFNPGSWGLDLKGVHKLVHKAIMECSMDVRKEMTRSIYLCGGVTMIPGLADRLQKELDKLTPPSLTPKVHSSPYRQHASYIGGCILAANDGFSQVIVSSSEWKQSGNSCLSKWHL